MSQPEYLTVSALTRYIKTKFDNDPYMKRVYLTGEISNFRKRPNHQYFSLKDDHAKISAVMFRGPFSRVKFDVQDGMKVLVVGYVSVYEASGSYQITIEHMEPDGIGALYQAFEQLKETIVPLVKMVVKKNDQIKKDYAYRTYPVEQQREFNRFLAEYIGFDFNKGVIAESVHPFTTNLHNKDVRITTAYLENLVESAMFSTIHEGGHALYEMGVDDAFTFSPVGGGSSMGMHESQSRLFENNIGRSRAFWEPVFPKLKELFKEQLQDVDFDTFMIGINKAEPSLIRTEADELTYCLRNKRALESKIRRVFRSCSN